MHRSPSQKHPATMRARFRALATICAAFVLTHAAFIAQAAEPGNGQKFDVYLPHPSGIGIKNHRSGVVCMMGEEPSNVCEGVYTVKITGKAICEWSEDTDYPCTWYGYQFDTENIKADTVITCDVANSIRTIFGPKTERVTGGNTAQYTIDLEAGQEHVFHPSYHTYAPVEIETAVVSVHACKVDGVPLYQVSYRAFYEPEN